jgi:3-oxoacyl-(acyl-carrier-protein) synthase
MKEAVYITGLGAVCAAGNSVSAVMDSLYSGKRSPGQAKRIHTDYHGGYPVFEVPDLADDGRTATEVFFLRAVNEALVQAGLDDPGRREGRRIGLCLGTTAYSSTLPSNEQRCRVLFGMDDPAAVPSPDTDILESVGRELGLTGPRAVIMNACASGTDAVGTAGEWLKADLCDMVIAAGADELSRISFLGFNALQVYSSEPCRPFDRERTGLNLGEGAGALVLEKQSIADERGSLPLAEVRGYGSFGDGYHLTAPHPEGRGLVRAVETALEQAGMTPSDIGFINAHGTGTPTNDRVEGSVIARVFPEGIPVCATKAFTGHTLGAAGALEAVFTVRNMLDGRLPPTPGFREQDPECFISPVRDLTLGQYYGAVSFSLAFGGTNSVLVFGRVS